MRHLLNSTCFLAVALLLASAARGAGPRHYVFFNMERERISEPSFLATTAFEGAQLKYTWRELEPAEGAYDFGAIERDLAFLRARGKRLFVQLQETSFDAATILVPRYLRDDPRFHGGVDQQYDVAGDDEARATPAGWVARRWDPAVRTRFHALLAALGARFDGRLKGLNLGETAVEFGDSGRLHPRGFTPAAYRDAVLANLEALKRAFPTSVVMQYANFMPGEWLPWEDRGYLRSVYRRARELKVGLGGPDLLPNKPSQMSHAYPLIAACAGALPTGVAVQDGNYEHRDPTTSRQVTIQDLVDFATDRLKVDYVFWCTQEPFYSGRLIPFLQRRK